MFAPMVISISDASCVGQARRAAARACVEAQFNDVDQGRVGIISTELATNLQRHAQHGKLLLQVIQTPSGRGVELLSVDSGPGIANVQKSLQDGFSTGGTAGNGLGAIRRLSSEFDLYSQREQGTIVLSRVFGQTTEDRFSMGGATGNAAQNRGTAPNWAGISICAPGEEVCGDNWRVTAQDDQLSVMVADGLGHGPAAAEASEKAGLAFEATPLDAAGVLLQKAHLALAGTRGAAVAVARINLNKSAVQYAGVGNISGTLISGSDFRGMCSHNGIVGIQMRKVQEFEYLYQETGLLIMHSDGLQTRWNLENYPGLVTCHPGVIAGVLYRDFVRGRDDVTVVVARWASWKGQAV